MKLRPFHTRDFRITAAVLVSDIGYPVLNKCKESLRKFDELILYTNQITDFADARNYVVRKAKYPFIFFLDSDETINPEVYDDLVRIFKVNSHVLVQFPRANLQKGNLYFSSPRKFPDLQTRAGHKKNLKYKGKVHEYVRGNNVTSRFIIVHYGNCIEGWNLTKLEGSQMKFESLRGESLFQVYDARTFQELLKKMENDQTKELSILASQGYILPSRKERTQICRI
jgi:hypothetical protein